MNTNTETRRHKIPNPWPLNLQDTLNIQDGDQYAKHLAITHP